MKGIRYFKSTVNCISTILSKVYLTPICITNISCHGVPNNE